MRINLSPLYPLQEGLDKEIHLLHHESYETTFDKRVLSLLVELGEFANETRCFKYWSLKGPSAKERILDEYADGLHFILSLGIAIGIREFDEEIPSSPLSLTEQLLLAYEEASSFRKKKDASSYKAMMFAFLGIIELLGYSEEDVLEAYKKKLKVNHQRQIDHY